MIIAHMSAKQLNPHIYTYSNMIILIPSVLILLHTTSAFTAYIEEPIATDKFSVVYLPSSEWNEKIAGNSSALQKGNVVPMGGNEQCYIPNPIDQDIVEAINHDDYRNYANTINLDVVLSDTLRDAVNILSSTFKNKQNCYQYQTGYWSYEFCSGNQVKQFHLGDASVNDDPKKFVIGNTKTLLVERNFKLFYNNDGYYIKDTFNGGDLCEMNGLPRSVEIQYTCGSNKKDISIEYVNELKICNYQLRVGIPKLCMLDIFKDNEIKMVTSKPNILPLYCNKPIDKPIDNNIFNLLDEYEPEFIGNGLYFMKSNNNIHKNKLMYSGSYETMFQKLKNMIDSIISLDSFQYPNGQKYNLGDEFQWVVDIINSKNNYIDTVMISVGYLKGTSSVTKKVKRTNPNDVNFISYNSFNVDYLTSDITTKDVITVLEITEKDHLHLNTIQESLLPEGIINKLKIGNSHFTLEEFEMLMSGVYWENNPGNGLNRGAPSREQD